MTKIKKTWVLDELVNKKEIPLGNQMYLEMQNEWMILFNKDDVEQVVELNIHMQLTLLSILEQLHR